MLIDIYKQSYFNRQFELRVAESHKKGLIKVPIYLSVGTEHIPATIADISKDWLIFPQHRNHSWLLSFGVDPVLMAKELLGRSDGLNQGYGGSASMGCPEKGIYPHDGHLGSNAAIGAGMALATKKPTIVHLGDAAVEEDGVLSTLGWAATHKAPVLFIVEDNDLSILTSKKQRRNWNIVHVAKGFGVEAATIEDYPSAISDFTKYTNRFGYPFLLNIKCNRHLWHCGSGCDKEPDRDIINSMRYSLVVIDREITEEKISQIETNIRLQINEVWNPLIGESDAS